MKRWIVYLLVLVFVHVYYFASMREVAKQFYDNGTEQIASAHYFSPNWNSPRADDIFMTKDTLGVIRYYKIVEGVKEGKLSLKSGKYNFSAGLTESISIEKWNFDFMNNPELYDDLIQEFSLDDFLALKENVYLTRGFGMTPTRYVNNPFYVEFLHYMVLILSIFSFFTISLFVFLNIYFSNFTRFSEEILLAFFSIVVTYFALRGYLIFAHNPSAYLLIYSRGLIYAFTLLYFINYLNKKIIKRWSFGDQEAAKFIAIIGGGSLMAIIGAYFQMQIVGLLDIDLFTSKFNISNSLAYHISPFHPASWLVVATGNFLNNFRNHFFQLRRKAKAFKYARKQELEFKSELETLQAKINPHFLYNSLNSIASLAQTDPEKTETMALALSKFYKEKTNRKENLWSTVAEEMDMLKTYLAIEQIRFGDRLAVELFTAEDANEEKIPRFLLQPLIENAIKYGYNSADNKITVKVFIERSNRVLSIRILDSGPKFSDQLNTGYGIRSVQKKLKLFYPGNHKMEFINTPEKEIFIQIKT